MGLYTGLYSHVPQRFLMSFWQGLNLADLYSHVPQRLYSQVQTLLEAHEEGGTHACTAYTSPHQLREAMMKPCIATSAPHLPLHLVMGAHALPLSSPAHGIGT